MSGQPAGLPMRQKMAQMARAAQARICAALEALDGGVFVVDSWQRAEGGGGVSRVLQDGTHLEKAGVNFSEVHGLLPASALASSLPGDAPVDGAAQVPFFATGVSVVVHPHNPMAPTAHCNYRYFELGEPGAIERWWFGGGADLTPSYLFEEDAVHFHRTHREVCDRFDPDYYPRFKAWCDDYFDVTHRGERRGIGGIFFDRLDDRDPQQLFAFAEACAAAFVPAYLPLLERRIALPFDEAHKRWQQLRRGRYVEFNLVHDRGTSFGLRSGGRTESILMSLPLTCRFEYGHEPAPDSEEARLLEVLRTPREWA